jgi:hypothetical protein
MFWSPSPPPPPSPDDHFWYRAPDAYAVECGGCGLRLPWQDGQPLPEVGPCTRNAPPGKCVSCGLETCRELDAYYGTDPLAAKQCTPCRLGRRAA